MEDTEQNLHPPTVENLCKILAAFLAEYCGCGYPEPPLPGPRRILHPSWAELHGASSQNTLGTRQGGLGGLGCGSPAGFWGGVTMLGGWEGRLC
ncbi:unnamed protein product [Eretmochelys imbricata]